MKKTKEVWGQVVDFEGLYEVSNQHIKKREMENAK